MSIRVSKIILTTSIALDSNQILQRMMCCCATITPSNCLLYYLELNLVLLRGLEPRKHGNHPCMLHYIIEALLKLYLRISFIAFIPFSSISLVPIPAKFSVSLGI